MNKKIEYKKRLFRLSSGLEPVAFQIRTKHKRRNPLLFTDPETGTVREMRYATNMNTPFVDEQEGKGTVTVGHVWFRDGVLAVNEREIALQTFLINHPDNESNGGKVFYEYDPGAEAKAEIENLEVAAEAMAAAKDLDIEDASAIVYRSVGSAIDRYSVSEIKRDLLTMAMKDASGLMDAIEDETVKIDWTAHQALKFDVMKESNGIITLGNSKKKLLQAKPGLTPEESISKFFLTDDGLAVLEDVKAKLHKLLN